MSLFALFVDGEAYSSAAKEAGREMHGHAGLAACWRGGLGLFAAVGLGHGHRFKMFGAALEAA